MPFCLLIFYIDTVGNKIDQSHAYYFLFSVYLKN